MMLLAYTRRCTKSVIGGFGLTKNTNSSGSLQTGWKRKKKIKSFPVRGMSGNIVLVREIRKGLEKSGN